MIRPVTVALLTAALLAGCGDGTEKPAPAKQDTAYKVIRDQHFSSARRHIDVVLDERLDKNTLGDIAATLKRRDKTQYEKTVIGFYIANEDQAGGYWATATYEPDLTVRVLGISREQIAALRRTDKPGANDNVLGVWLDDRPHVRATLELLKGPDGVVLKSVDAQGNTALTPMSEARRGEKTVLRDPQNPDSDRYLVINENGQLEFWGAEGRYYTASSL